MSTDMTAYQRMRENSHIIILTDFDEVENVFDAILRRFVDSKDPCLCVGLDLEWKPKVVYGQWGKEESRNTATATSTATSTADDDSNKSGSSWVSTERKENPVSLLQVSLSEDGCKRNYLIRMLQVFNISRCGWVHPSDIKAASTIQTVTANPSTSRTSHDAVLYGNCALFRFLSDPRVLKFGVGISGDRRRLRTDFGILMQGTVELGKYLQKVSLYPLPQKQSCSGDSRDSALNRCSCSADMNTDTDTDGALHADRNTDSGDKNQETVPTLGSTPLLISPTASLQRIVQCVLGLTIPKEKAVQCGDWEAVSLSEDQVLYAASDSYHALLVCEAVLVAAQNASLGAADHDGTENCFLSFAAMAFRLAMGLVDSGAARSSLNTAAYSTAVSNLRPDDVPVPVSASQNTSTTSSSSNPVDPIAIISSKRKPIVSNKICRLRASQTPIYESCALIGHDGKFLSYCDQKRVNWYLKKGLADEVDAENIARFVALDVLDASVLTTSGRVAQLRFEAKGTGNRDDSYKRQKLQNRCVVCGLTQKATVAGPGEDLQLLHHHVVPKAYRRVFPSCIVSKNNHDIVPICKKCKANVALIYANKMQVLEMTYVPQDQRDALVTARRIALRPGPLRLSLTKVQTLCASLLQTTEFVKKMKVDNLDGSRRVETVSVGIEKTFEIKQQMMKSLHIACNKLLDSEESRSCRGEDESTGNTLRSLQRDGMSLSADQPDRVREFLARYEELAAVEQAEKERARREVEEPSEAEVDTYGNQLEGGIGIPASAGVDLKTIEGLVVSSFIHPLSLDAPLDTYLPKLHEFETMWRQFFIDSVAPRHMPPHWKINYKHQHNEDPSSF